MKKLLLTTFTLLCALGINTQQKLDKRYCFEPVIGTFYPMYQFKTTPNISLYNEAQPGLKFGIIKNLSIGKSPVWVIRPGLLFGGYKRNTFIQENEGKAINFNSEMEVHVQAPLHISQNLSTGKRKTFLYFVEGATFGINAGSESVASKLWLEKSSYITLDIGTGVRFYNNRKHLFAIELIYSFGLHNLKQPKNNFLNQETDYFNKAKQKQIAQNIEKINIHFLSLQLLF